jgi:hypothetical protein
MPNSNGTAAEDPGAAQSPATPEQVADLIAVLDLTDLAERIQEIEDKYGGRPHLAHLLRALTLSSVDALEAAANAVPLPEELEVAHA